MTISVPCACEPIFEATRFCEEKINGKKKERGESREHVRLVLLITARYICVFTESTTKVEGSRNGHEREAEDSNEKKEKEEGGKERNRCSMPAENLKKIGLKK